jgi:hypothetical protein
MANDFAAPKKKKNKALLFALVGVGLLATTVGGVFAANSITINSGGTIEFGQGLVSTSTCDAALTTSISQAYNATADAFYADEILVTGVDDTSCLGKTVHVSLIGDTDGNGAMGVVCGVAGDDTSGADQDSFVIAAGDDDLTVTIAAACDATTVTKVAITTS